MHTAEPTVRAPGGTVRGAREGGLAVFRGIPYALPPVGGRHLRAPERVPRWTGVRVATAFGPPPPQSSPWPAGPPSGDDWLTLNVWTPDPGAAGLPVLVWVHGGAYLLGFSGDPLFDGAGLARGGLVVVSMNYRVGAEGFAEVEGLPSNRGLRDQVAALEWVQENVAAFGGDPARVTLCGESAGAGSVAALMTGTGGLFRRAITQSVPGVYFTAGLARDVGLELARRVGAPLVDADPGVLADALVTLARELPAFAATWGTAARTSNPVGPVLDGDLLADVPWRAGGDRGVDLLAGHTRDEARLFLAMSGQLGKVSDADARSLLDDLAPDAGAYLTAYPDAGAEQLYETVYSDAMLRMPTIHVAEAHAGAGGRTFAFELSWPAPGLGAAHGIDVPLLFGSYDSPAGGMLLGPATDEIRALGDQLRRAWTAFAEHGDPGWPAFTGRGGPTRIFDGGAVPVVTPYPQARSRALWSAADLTPFALTG